MYRKVLPTYTSERYFLLAEINEACSIISLDTTICLKEAKVSIIYTLWIQADGIPALVDALAALYHKSLPCTTIIIETFSSREDIGADGHFETISRAHSAISSAFPAWSDAVIIFAVSSFIVATPGLECVYDLNLQYKLELKTDMQLLVAANELLLGHDKSAEPDAISGVTQMLISNVMDPVQVIAARADLQPRRRVYSPSARGSGGGSSSLHVTAILMVLLALVGAYYYQSA